MENTVMNQKTPSWNSDQKFEIFENLKCVMYSCLFKTLMILYLDTIVAVLFSDLFKCKFVYTVAMELNWNDKEMIIWRLLKIICTEKMF